MNLNYITNAILALVPDAKFGVWSYGDYYGGEDNPIHYENYLIDWSPLNSVPCPSWEDIQAQMFGEP